MNNQSMNNQITFEYFSTFPPMSDTFLNASPAYKKVETETDILPLQLPDNSCTSYFPLFCNIEARKKAAGPGQ